MLSFSGSSFRLERESSSTAAKGYFGSQDQSKVSSSLFSGGKPVSGSEKPENTPILDELSKNPLFARHSAFS